MTHSGAKPKIGLALGSGGARGWCHIGAIRALQEQGIEADIVAGCSMGALVGAAYAAGALDALEDWARTIDYRKMADYIDVSFNGGGIILGRHIVDVLNEINGNTHIENLGKPFKVVASDLIMGREVWLDKGPVNEAVRASIALPGIFTPVKHGDKWLLDGGMTNPVPVSACRAMGAEIIIAVLPNAGAMGPRSHPHLGGSENSAEEKSGDVFSSLFDSLPMGIGGSIRKAAPDFFRSKEKAPGYLDVLSTSIDIMTNQILRSRLAGEPPHVMINPMLNHISVLEFNRAEEAITEGHKATKLVQHQIDEYLR